MVALESVVGSAPGMEDSEARANRHIPEHWFLCKEQKTTKKRKEQQEEQKTTKKRKEKQLGDEGEGEAALSLGTGMSMEDAAMRVKLGWKLWDHQLWTAAFGTASQLQNMVQPVARFIENRKHIVIGQSDQIAIWLRTGPCEEQKIAKKRKVNQLDGGNEGQVSAVSFLPVKYVRVTYEARQVIHNYFDESQEPKGVLWKGALIVKGNHGRLHNISPEGIQQTFKHKQQNVTPCLNTHNHIQTRLNNV
jgi:hypothetical protein